jgi:hypothetical protein
MPLLPAPIPGFAAWTPRVDQGATTDISKTVVFARYAIHGTVCFVEARMTITGAGTANNSIDITNLPVAPKALGGTLFGTGGCFVRDADAAADYRGTCTITDSGGTNGVIAFRRGDNTAQQAIGVSPNIALANNDIVSFAMFYEIA